MVSDWSPNALIEFKCDVFFKTLKNREFRNSLFSAASRTSLQVCHPSRLRCRDAGIRSPLTFVITNEVRDLLFLRLATLRVPHPFAGLAKGWESVRRVTHLR